MSPTAQSAKALARLLLAGPFTAASGRDRVKAALGRCPRWMGPLLKELAVELGEGSRPRLAKVSRRIAANEKFMEACALGQLNFPGPGLGPVMRMQPAAGIPESWKLPELTTIGDLAAWLNLTPGELEWFADVRLLNPRSADPRLQNYVTRWQAKPDGNARLIESPKLRLKLLQRTLLRRMLDAIPPHEAVHGFRAGHSIRTFVAEHAGCAVVVRADLMDFFPSISRARVLAIFLTAGYPEPVALRIAALCTTRLARGAMESYPGTGDFAKRDWLRRRYGVPHLPQGAPTSPALANLAAFRLDCRLSGLANSLGATYTRYADDLVFSGGEDFAKASGRFLTAVCAIALEEGFELNTRKTRVMRQGVSQRAAGLVLNDHPNIAREEFDRLKAILHNCRTRGPTGQNHAGHPDFRAHLMGRVAHVESITPRRGARLRQIFDRIDWSGCTDAPGPRGDISRDGS